MRWVFIAEWAVRLVMFLVIITRKRSVAAALGWLVVVAFLPFAGAALYLMFGEIRLGHRRSRQYQSLMDAVRRSPELRRQFQRLGTPDLSEPYRTISRLAGAVGARDPRPGNRMEPVNEPSVLFGRMVDDINAAGHHCHLVFYIADDSDDDPITRAVTDALAAAARRGVRCRLLLDASGSRHFLRGATCRRLRDAGVEVCPALPVNALRAMVARIDLRNHRKLAVIDGRVGYMGSHNLTDPVYRGKEAFGEWMDISVRVEGPVVYDIQETFLDDWAFNAGPVPDDEAYFPPVDPADPGITASLLPTAPTKDRRAPLLDVIVQTLQLARERVVLTTPYFVPDDALLAAMRTAALRGVEVVLVLPHRGDSRLTQAAGRSHYGYLLEAGVRILEYPGALLHAKTLTLDREFAILGSANLDVRSFSLNFELALLVFDTDFASRLHYLQEEYMEGAERVRAEAWARRGFIRTFGDNVARLTTPIL